MLLAVIELMLEGAFGVDDGARPRFTGIVVVPNPNCADDVVVVVVVDCALAIVISIIGNKRRNTLAFVILSPI